MRAIRGWASGIMVAGLLAGGLTVAPPTHAQPEAPVRCASQDNRLARCDVPWRRVELYKQESRAACVEGRSWGMERGALWVDNGCRGLFGPAAGRGYGNRYRDDHRRDEDRRPGNDWNRQINLQCASVDNKYQMCRVDVGRNGSVRLTRRISDARCIQGDSWGWNRAGVWVARGCRAQFQVNRRR